jgi:hypothetical protein
MAWCAKKRGGNKIKLVLYLNLSLVFTKRKGAVGNKGSMLKGVQNKM